MREEPAPVFSWIRRNIPGGSRFAPGHDLSGPELDENDPGALLRHLTGMRIRVKGMTRGEWAGGSRSLTKGQGIEWRDLREYVPGDDVRAIDWNVTARHDGIFVREFVEDRERTLHLMLDMSGSVSFGTRSSKRLQILEIAAALAFGSADEGNAVGASLYTDRIERFVPARKGQRHALAIVKTLASFRPAGTGTDLSAAIGEFSRRVTRKSTVVILSDFIGPPFQTSLSVLGRRHEVVAVRVSDPCECVLPDAGYVSLEDSETGEQIVLDTSDPGVRQRYAESVAGQFRTQDREFMRSRTRRVSVSTAEPCERHLVRFFSQKQGAR